MKIIPEPSATRNAMFKVIRSNTEIAITPPRIARLRSDLVQSFNRSQAIHCKCSRSKIKRQGHVVNDKVTRKVMYQQHKSYNTAIDIFSDFSLGWRRNYSGKGLAWLGGEGGSSCNAFAIATFSSYIIISFNELRFTLAHSIALYLPTS